MNPAIIGLSSVWSFLVNLTEEWTMGMTSFWVWFNTPMQIVGDLSWTPAQTFTMSGILLILLYKFIRFLTV